MNRRYVNIALLALNLGLLGTIGYMAYVLKLSPELSPFGPRARLVTNTVTQIAVRKVFPTNFLASWGKLPINWRAIESTNYQVYIDNLRAIDCPEETIRDIIVTDVAKLFAKRRAIIRAQGPPYRFWQTGESWENGPTRDPAIRRQLQALEKEERDLVRDLLGVNLQTELAKYWSAEDEQDRMYGFVDEEKRQRILEIQARYDEFEQEVYANSKGVVLDEDQERLRRIQKQKEAELAAVLTPEEFEEYELRNSATANSLRTQMSGFQPSEEEFRKIFRLQKTYDAEFNQAFNATDGTQSEARAKAQQAAQDALNAEIKSTLGEARFNEWTRAQDADYKAMVQMAERFSLPQDTAGKVYDMKQQAERQKQRIDENPGLTPEQRNVALTAIARETARFVATTMGDQVFRSYQKANGQWLQDLAVSAAPPPEPAPPPPAAQFQPPLPPGLPGYIPPAIIPLRPKQ